MPENDPQQQIPTIPARFVEPTPVIAVGLVVWVLATGVVYLVGDRWAAALPTCWTGIAVGCAGFVMFYLQRRSARRGDKGAQRGLT